MPLILPGVGAYVGQMARPPKIRMADVLFRVGVWPPALCLDAGDLGCYNPAANGQVVWDISGNNFSFYRGATASAEGSDLLFNGVAGAITRNEYFYGNAGQYLSSVSLIPVWADHFHFNAAKYTLLAWVYMAATAGSRGILGNLGGNAANTGFQWSMDAGTPTHSIEVYSGTADLQKGFSDSLPVAGAWNCIGMSVDENGGAVSFGWSNGKQSALFNANYVAPSAGRATLNLQAGSKGNGVAPLLLGDALACVVAWTGVAYPVTVLNSIYDLSKHRFLGPVDNP